VGSGSSEVAILVNLTGNAHPAPLTLPVNKLAEGSIMSPEDTAQCGILSAEHKPRAMYAAYLRRIALRPSAVRGGVE
jgi:hypothetical protein